MTKELENAINTVKNICEQYKGTKQEHIIIENCLSIITNELGSCSCKQEKLVKTDAE